MTTETTPRDRIHIKHCRDPRCFLEIDTPGPQCQNLDFLLDQVKDEGFQAAIEVMRQEKLPMSVGLLEAQLELNRLDRQKGSS